VPLVFSKSLNLSVIQRKSKPQFRALKKFMEWGNEELLRVLTQMEKIFFPPSVTPLGPSTTWRGRKKSGT
jgi:hypothetical protein